MTHQILRKKIIINHISASRKPYGYGEAVLKDMLKKYMDVPVSSIAVTEYGGHATDIARSSTAADMIIAVGGDGTIGEVLNGMDVSRQILGVIPYGTGNSLARDTGIRKLTVAMEAVKNCRVRKVDLIKARFRVQNDWHTKYVVATCGIGYTAKVTNIANHCFKKIRPLCYPIASMIGLSRQRKLHAKISVDSCINEKDVEFTMFVVNNTQFAGNFRVFPRAAIDDGEFDITYGSNNFLRQLLFDLSVLTRLYFYAPAKFLKAKSLKIALQKPALLMLDGEIFDNVSEVIFEIQPQMLNLVV